jgi:hypothetical protein
MTRVILRAVVAFAAFVAGCEAVPDLTFPPDGAPDSSEDAQPPADDAGLGNCPEAAALGYTCCGTVPCFGTCDQNVCLTCMNKKCMTGDFCCPKTMSGMSGNVNVSCLPIDGHCQP